MSAHPKFLRTKVARRILGLFVLCAVLPIGTLAVIAYRDVVNQLNDQSAARLRQASKAAGMAIVERLDLVEAELRSIGVSLKDAPRGASVTRTDVSRPTFPMRFRGLVVVADGGTAVPLFGRAPEPPALTGPEEQHLRSGKTLLGTTTAAPTPAVLMASAIDPRDWGRGILWAEVDPGYLWGAGREHGAVSPATATCVFDHLRQPLSCSPDLSAALLERLQPALASVPSGQFEWTGADGEFLAGYWSVFLKFRYVVPNWLVVLSESKADVLAPVASFKRTFTLAVLLALLVVFLISNVQIRRSMEPLAALQEGTRRIALRDFDRPVHVTSGDEFESLAAAFNEMAVRLREHFDESERLNSALRQSGALLLESEARVRIILEMAVDAVVTTTDRGIIDSFNQTAERMFGYSRQEVIGKSIAILIPDSSYPHLGRQTTAGHSHEVIARRRDGTTFPVELAVSEARLAQRFIVTTFFRDITARKQAEKERVALEAQLRQSHKMETVGALAGGIAHDLGNLLTPILAYVDLAMQALSPGDPIRADLEEVKAAATRAKDLVRQILIFSRRGEQRMAAVQIPVVVDEALALLRASLPTTIEMRRDIDADSSVVVGDETQIHQVLMNLCTNAAHAMHDTSGVLEVSVKMVEVDAERARRHPNLHAGAYVRLSVRDTGCGMDRAVMERIFEPFFTTKRPGEGTGLGLSVVHGIVMNHGGAITVDSEPGKGARFDVFLPAVKDAAARQLPPVEAEVQGHEHILVVDDEPAVAQATKRVLERLGYHVTVRTNSVEALEAFRGDPHDIDVVITDQTMPQMTGAQLAEELLRIRPDVPIILMSGFLDAVAAAHGATDRFRERVMKPVEVRDLGATVRRVLKPGPATAPHAPLAAIW